MPISNLDPVAVLVGNVFFPIAAFYLMFRLATKTIQDNTAALKELKVEVVKLRRR